MPSQRQPTAQTPGQCRPLPSGWGHNGGTIGWPSIRSDQWLASIRSVLAGPASDGWLAQASDQHMAVAGPAARSDQTRVRQPPHIRSDKNCGRRWNDRWLSDLGWAEYLLDCGHIDLKNHQGFSRNGGGWTKHNKITHIKIISQLLRYKFELTAAAQNANLGHFMECSLDCPISHSAPRCPLPPGGPSALLTITPMPHKTRHTTPTAQPRLPASAPPVRPLFGVNCPTHTHPPSAARIPALIHTPQQRPITMALTPTCL